MKILKLKNYHVYNSPLSLQAWLMSLELERKPSRARSRFVKMTVNNAKDIEEYRQELIKKYGKYTEKKVGEKGKEKIEKELVYVIDPKTGNKTDQIELADPEGYNKEFGELLEEDFILDVTPAVEGTINTIKDLLLNSDAKFSGKIATLYDEWCDGFESIAEAPVAKEEVKKEKEEAKAQ
jgi:hypothetical protein